MGSGAIFISPAAILYIYLQEGNKGLRGKWLALVFPEKEGVAIGEYLESGVVKKAGPFLWLILSSRSSLSQAWKAPHSFFLSV